MSDVAAPPVQTPLDRLAPNLEEQKRLTLEALARSGQAGVDALQAAQQQTRDAQLTALQGTVTGAQSRGASAAATAELGSIVRQPGDRQLQELAGQKGTFEADLARQTADYGRYMGEVNAGIGTVREYNQGKVDLAKTLWEQDQALKAQKAAGSGGGGGGGGGAKPKAVKTALEELEANSDAELTKRLMGAAEMKQQATANRQEVVANVSQGLAESAQNRATTGTVKMSNAKGKNTTLAGAIRGETGQGNPDAGKVMPLAIAPKLSPIDARHYGDEQATKATNVLEQQLAGAQQRATRAAAETQPHEQKLLQTQTTPLYEVARGIGQAAGLDPTRVYGVLPPSTRTLATGSDIERQIASQMTSQQREGDYLSQTGFDNPSEQRTWQQAQQDLTTNQVDQAIAQKAGIADPTAVPQLRLTPEYQIARNVAESAIQRAESGQTDGYALDDNALRQVLAQALATQTPNLDAAARTRLSEVVVAEVANRLQPASYVPLEDDELSSLTGG